MNDTAAWHAVPFQYDSLFEILRQSQNIEEEDTGQLQLPIVEGQIKPNDSLHSIDEKQAIEYVFFKPYLNKYFRLDL